jgi:hypothetical protein
MDAQGEPQSRFLKDIFHALQQIEVRKDWPLAGEFYKTFSEAVFQYDAEDYKAVQAVLAKRDPPTSIEQMVMTDPRYVHQRVRRYPHKPSQLAANLRALKNAFGDAVYKGSRVFSAAQLKSFDSLIDLAATGYLTDPPGLKVHSPVSQRKPEQLGLASYSVNLV